jgi:hypothetical protein
MKRLPLVIFFIGVPLFITCSDLATKQSETAVHDTLYRTFRQDITGPTGLTRYLFVCKKENGDFDTTWSNVRSPFELSPLGTLQHMRTISRNYVVTITNDTVVRIVHYARALDTIVVSDTVRTDRRCDAIVKVDLPVPWDSADPYLRSHPPKFTQKDSLIEALKVIPEGYFRNIEVKGVHYYNDSVEILFCNKPKWVNFTWGSSNCYRTDGRYYSRCHPDHPNMMTMLCDDPREGLPSLAILCDSTQVDSVYTWQMIMRNKYGAADTVNFSSSTQKDSCLFGGNE